MGKGRGEPPQRRWLLAALALSAAAMACGGVPPSATAPPDTPTPAPTATPSPWLLIGEGTPAEIREAARAWAEAVGIEARVAAIVEQPARPPEGLWGVVATEAEIAPRLAIWSALALIVAEPEAIAAGPRTTTLGPRLRFDQAGFLAGVAAGLATKSHGVGYVASSQVDGEAYLSGFEEGVRYACPKCRLERMTGLSQIPFGVDVVGLPPEAVLPDDPPAADGPWLVLLAGPTAEGWQAAMAARLTVVPEALVEAALQGLWDGETGLEMALAVETGALQVEINPQAISPGRERLLRQAEQALADGMLVVGGGDG